MPSKHPFRHLQDEMLFYLFDVCIYVYIHVFYGGPHGRIAKMLNVFTL